MRRAPPLDLDSKPPCGFGGVCLSVTPSITICLLFLCHSFHLATTLFSFCFTVCGMSFIVVPPTTTSLLKHSLTYTRGSLVSPSRRKTNPLARHLVVSNGRIHFLLLFSPHLALLRAPLPAAPAPDPAHLHLSQLPQQLSRAVETLHSNQSMRAQRSN